MAPPSDGNICFSLFNDEETSLKIHVSVAGESDQRIFLEGSEQTFDAGATLYEFESADREYDYDIVWDYGNRKCHYTITHKKPPLVVAVSCDNPDFDIQNSLWNSIAALEPQLCIHLGDNIYGDRTFRHCVRQKCSHTEAVAKYVKAYKHTFGRWVGRLHCPHILLSDDHEVADKYTGEEGTKFSRYSDYVDAARVANGCFNPTTSNSLSATQAHFFEDLACISISRLANSEICGSWAIKQIEEHLEGRKVRDLILSFGVPPLPQPERASLVHDVIFGKWPMDSKIVAEFYRWCFSWLQAEEGRRLMVIGGDLHMGITTKVSLGEHSFKVHAVGPVSTQPTISEISQGIAFEKRTSLEEFGLETMCRAYRNYLVINTESMSAVHIWADQSRCSLWKSIVGLGRLLIT